MHEQKAPESLTETLRALDQALVESRLIRENIQAGAPEQPILTQTGELTPSAVPSVG